MSKCDLCLNGKPRPGHCLCDSCESSPYARMINEIHATIGLSGYTLREITELERKVNLTPEVRAFLESIANCECYEHDENCSFYESHEKCSKCSCGDGHVCDYGGEAGFLLAKLPEVDT